jgi:transcriptional regulator with XRE-family HTH domain
LTIEKIFGLALQELRKARKMSQEELGFESGYHRTYISQLERGQKSPSLRAIFKLAVALKAAPSELVLTVEKTVGGAKEDPVQMRNQTDENNTDRTAD